MSEYFQKGFESALKSKCSLNALPEYLDEVAALVLNEAQLGDKEKLDLSTKFQLENVQDNAQQTRIEKNIASLKQLIKNREALIATKELERLTNSDARLNDKPSDPFLSFAIGTTITLLLTLYLLLFYSSTGFSMLYDVPATGNGIFNPSIFSIALSRGGGAIGFVILFPVIFLAVGFAMYVSLEKYHNSKLNNDKGSTLWVGLIVTTTFIMDSIIGYKIAHGVYVRDYNKGLYDELWSGGMIFTDVNFYLVLILGFAAYLIWGFLLNYVLSHPYRKHQTSPYQINSTIITLQDEVIAFSDQLNALETRSKALNELLSLKSITQEKIRKGEIPAPVYALLLEKPIQKFMDGYLSYAKNAFLGVADGETRLTEIMALKDNWLTTKIQSFNS